jgi:glycosyltransferase involved in cell wall biosynthesis
VKNVHAHLPRAELLVALSLNSKTRMIVSRHNAEQFFPRAPKFLSTALSQFVVSKSVRVIAISSAVSKFLIESQEVKEEEKIEIIYYGSATASPKFIKSDVPSRILGTVARLTEQKDYGTLLRAFGLFLEVNPGYRLQIIGVGHLEAKLKMLAVQIGVSENVDWLGKVSEPNNYIATWDLFILTSLYEGFGLVLLESMALEIPIVASENSAITEVLGSDYLGLARTSDPEDFFEKMLILTKEEGRSGSLKQLRHNSIRFQAESMASSVCELYA